MIRRETCRAARGLLDWTRDDLAREAGVSPSAIRKFEAGDTSPVLSTVIAITEAFTRAGVEFTDGDAPGVRLHMSRGGSGDGQGEGPAQDQGRPGRRRGPRTAEAMVAA